jgi:hypothetical protein
VALRARNVLSLCSGVAGLELGLHSPSEVAERLADASVSSREKPQLPQTWS